MKEIGHISQILAYNKQTFLTQFWPIFHLYAPRKHKKTKGNISLGTLTWYGLTKRWLYFSTVLPSPIIPESIFEANIK